MLLIDRAKSILLQPRPTWREIAGEFTKPGELWGRYILPLASIGPLAVMACWMIFGKPVLMTSLTNPVPLSTAITRGVAEYVLVLMGVFVLMQILNTLAPTFGTQKNEMQALKAAAYSQTATWIGGLFGLIPALWPVKWIFFLYTLVLLFVGLPIVMKSPPSQSTGYAAVGTIAAFVVFLLIRAVLTAF